MERTITIMGREYETTALQKLYRERYLKITQTQMSKLTGQQQPNIAAHEIGKSVKPCIDRAFDMLGFSKWASSVVTCKEEAEMLADLLDPTSGLEYLTTAQAEAIGMLKKGA